MSILKASLLAASFALVAASSANAQTTRDDLFHEWTVSATKAPMQARRADASQKSQIKTANERAPVSREANEWFTW